MTQADAPERANAPNHVAAPRKSDVAARKWHASPPEDVIEALAVDPAHGLSDSDVAARRSEFGENRLEMAAQRSMLARLASQFNNFFIYLLLVAGAITGALGEWLDSMVIFGVVLIIAVIGFVQEGRAERALDSVRKMLSQKAWVRRDGRRHQIDAGDLVPGDIVYLEAGDRTPADIRLVRTRNLQIQESALTGESTPVEKQVDPVEAEAEIGDRVSMGYSGTVVTAGHGTGVVVATGKTTELGRISGMLSDVEKLKTPLMRRLDAFSRVLSVIILLLAAVTFAVGAFVWGRDWSEMFFAAVSIAVAAIPEGLPAVMTVTLAIGVERMARRNAIIRRLPAVETLGSVTTVCADKTGTLTRNEMTVKTLRLSRDDFGIDGVGYEPVGDFTLEGAPVEPGERDDVLGVVRAGLLCNDSEVAHKDGSWSPEGDPMEAALIVLARKAGLEPEADHKDFPRLDAIPFASERQYMATLHHDHDGNHFIYVKGAPERLLQMCSHEARGGDIVELDAGPWHERVDDIAGRGQRLLAAARKDVGEMSEITEKDVESGLVFLGLFGLIDPPRDEAIASVAACRNAGIRVKMITGDHAKTASAVAGALGLENVETALTGRELEQMSDEEMRQCVKSVDVFARSSPEHKLRLVKALQAEGEIVAMTGDGVNDAPALKRADIGIAMGNKGTEAAREASAMVLADDNFASIERAIGEGRTVYDNLRKSILFILPTNAAQALIIVTAILFGLVLPVTPVQILWVNMVTAVTLGIAFAWEKAEGAIMARKPHPVEEPLLTGFVIWRVGLVGFLLLAGAGGLFLWQLAEDPNNEEFARTMAVNALVMGQIFYLLNTRYFFAPAYNWRGLTGNPVALIAIAICLALQLLFTYAPFMNVLFGSEPLDARAWAACVAVGLATFVIVEIDKVAVRARAHPFASTLLSDIGSDRQSGSGHTGRVQTGRDKENS